MILCRKNTKALSFENFPQALEPNKVTFQNAPLVHSGLENQGDEGQKAVFLDWYMIVYLINVIV